MVNVTFQMQLQRLNIWMFCVQKCMQRTTYSHMHTVSVLLE